MKGIVFTEFIDLVTAKFGEAAIDRVITECNLPSGAAYTAVGTYDHAELMTMVRRLAHATGVPVPSLLKDFAEHLFTRFAARYPHFFVGVTSSFCLLSRIEGYIHVEVRKLYPDAELPSIVCERRSENEMVLTYRSTRPLAAFAEGLMLGAIAHFGETVEVIKTDCAEDDTYVRFELRKS
jgi:hypothetical protein